ncbi:hypothetical protein [Nocardia sp. CDC160]|uniref:hypothetical protein n=1 Tax=Nocardia sp. CDC160 TaxID=3112166 RepID=UPI002DB5935E|nr:hypothetical protein [Nocardia sp. CDC160]MEC3920193.1 hypothetical protein [Nocardia sp. CDC160]
MSVRFSYDRDPESNQWIVTGTDGVKSIVISHDSQDEAVAQVTEAFGLKAYRPPPPPPPGHYRFVLLDTWLGSGDARPDDPRYDAIKVNPPQGCTIGDFIYSFGLECVRPGTDLLDAISSTCSEIRETYGHFLADVGVEKVEEWSSDGRNGWGAKILAQLLLMAVERAHALGYTTDELMEFIRRVDGAPPTQC